jgi:hypothetical protein
MKVKDTTIDHHNDHDFNYQEVEMLSNDNGTQEQELGDERASIPLDLSDVIDTVKKLVEIGELIPDVCEAIDSIAAQDGDINKQRELLEQTEKLSKDVPSLKQEYIQNLFYNLVFGHPNDEPHDGEQ